MESQPEQVTTNIYVTSYHLLQTAKTTIDMQQAEIDELHEQNILMRTTLKLFTAYIDDNHYRDGVCAWCGCSINSDISFDEAHSPNCVLYIAVQLLKTIPEIK